MTKSHTEWGEEYNLKRFQVRLDEIYADWTEERDRYIPQPRGRLTIREACRQRRTLSGTDAQALEGGLQQMEVRVNELQDGIKEIRRKWGMTLDRVKEAEAEVERLKAIAKKGGE